MYISSFIFFFLKNTLPPLFHKFIFFKPHKTCLPRLGLIPAALLLIHTPAYFLEDSVSHVVCGTGFKGSEAEGNTNFQIS